jgi:hypothetical protein
MRERLIELCASNGLHLRITPWDIVSDLGSDRFAHPDSDDIARAHRAELVALFVDATVKLMLDSMVEENGQWRLETWQHRENHSGSFFDSMHHMFCNLTDFTLMVQMQMSKMQGSEDDVLLVRTPYMPGFAPINLKKITDKFSWWRLKS